MPTPTLDRDARFMVQKTNQTIELCMEDVNQARTTLKDFIKANKDRFADTDISQLLDMLESLDLVEDRLKDANEEMSDLLFGSDE